MEPSSFFTVSFFHRQPLLVVNEVRGDGSGRVLVVDAQGVTLQASEELHGFGALSKVWKASPDDRFIAGLCDSNSLLTVLEAVDCSELMQVRLFDDGDAPSSDDLSLFFSPDSLRTAVVCTSVGSDHSSIQRLWIVDIERRALAFVGSDPCPGISGIFGYLEQGLLCTRGSLASQGPHAVEYLVVGDAAESVKILPTEASAWVRLQPSLEQVVGGASHVVVAANFATSPDGTFLAVLGGLGLPAWKIQFVRCKTRKLLREWVAPHGPVEAGHYGDWRLYWSRDNARLVAQIDRAGPPYTKTWVLCLDARRRAG